MLFGRDAGSYESLLHAACEQQGGAFALDFRGGPAQLTRELAGPLLERAIGVIYKPRTERQSHYFHTCATRAGSTYFDLMAFALAAHRAAGLMRVPLLSCIRS